MDKSSRKPFCWVMVPGQQSVETLGCFWGAVGHLAQEGKDVLCQMPSRKTLSVLKDRKINCDELVIVGLDSWEKDRNIKHIQRWAKENSIEVRVLHPETWKDLL